jgi:hypothetical protein
MFKLNKPNNFDIKDAAGHHVVYMLQHRTSRPTARSTQDTTVNALNKNLSPLLTGKYGNGNKQFT